MPTYVYRFIDTGETIEVRQSFEDAALTEAPHPSDGKLRPVKKVFTPVGITFKGSGFYKTDASSSKSSTTPPSTTTSGDSSTTPATPSTSSTPAAPSAPAAPSSPTSGTTPSSP